MTRLRVVGRRTPRGSMLPDAAQAAMDVLAAGGSLAEAKELLGHVYTVTTMAYAKVDLASLRELVVPFGQVPR